MRGDLSDVSAADACRLLAGKGADGSLLLDGADGPGSIVFEGGRIIAATSPSRGARLGDRLVGAGYLDDDELGRALDEQRSDPAGRRLGAVLVDGGYVPHHAVRLFVQEQVLDALFELVRWRYGSFEFRSDVPTVIPEVGIALSVDETLVETARRQREWDELSQVIPDLDAVPVFASGATSASAGLEADEFAVLASIDGQRTIRELADDLGYGEFEAARIVYALTLLGIVEIELPEDEIGAALEDALLGLPWDTDQLVVPPAEQVAAWERAAQPPPGDDPPPEVDDAASEPATPTDLEEADDASVADAPTPADHAPPRDAPTPVDDAPAAIDAEPTAGPDDGPSPWEFFPEPASSPSSALPPPPAEAASGERPHDVPPSADPPVESDPPSTPPPAAVPQPPPAGTPVTVEADLPGPSFSDIIGELHRIGDDAPAAPPAPAQGPASEPTALPADQPAGPAGRDDEGSPAPTDVPERSAPASQPDAAAPSADVHEFLRELSRLALDEDVELPSRPTPRRDDPADDDGDDTKPKRRGIFGWGG